MRALIVDDEPAARAGLRALLGREPDVEVVGEAGDAVTAVDAIGALDPDVVFLDVQMPGGGGFAVVRAIGPAGPAVVFVTAFDDHALEAFEANAVDYLVKPFDPARLSRGLDRLRRFLGAGGRGAAADGGRAAALRALLSYLGQAAPPTPRPPAGERLAVREAGRLQFVPVESIQWIESRGNYVALHTDAGRPLLRGTLTDVLARLDPSRFLRVSRSHAVNLDGVREMRARAGGGWVLVLANGATVRASRRYGPRVAERLRGA